MALNWRHKVGLLLILIAGGVGLLFDLNAKQVTGIGLIGVAFAWLFGSLALRTLGFVSSLLISILGLYLTAQPLWKDWRTAEESASQYDSALQELRIAVKESRNIVWDAATPEHDPWGDYERENLGQKKDWFERNAPSAQTEDQQLSERNLLQGCGRSTPALTMT
jgi:hypothetical protein